MILLLLLWKYSEIVLSLRVNKYEILPEFLNIFDNLCDAVQWSETPKKLVKSRKRFEYDRNSVYKGFWGR